MSDSGEKTKKPTAKKKRESKKKGEVAKVPTIPKLLSLVAVFELMLQFRDTIWHMMEAWFTHALGHLHLATGNLGNYALFSLVGAPLLSAALMLCIGLLVVASLLAMIGNILQTGLIFSPEAIPKAEYLDPVSNAKQMLSPEQLLQLPMNLLKVFVIGLGVTISVALSLNDILHLADNSLEYMFNSILDILATTERSVMLCLFLCVTLDWGIRRHFYSKQIMMTQEEYDREMKEEYGNRHVRGQRKKITNEIMFGEAKRRVAAKADAVVVNPTHFAVALLYSPEECPLPVVLVRGSGEVADIIRDIAKKNHIPIVRSIWLARTLYAVGKEGRPIPRLTVRAVAAVYRVVLQLGAQGKPMDEVIEVDQEQSGEGSA